MYRIPGNPEPERRKNVERLVRKSKENGGIVIGFHGISATRARRIAVSGFEDRAPERGQWRDVKGVYFWDEEYKRNALGPGRNRASEDGDDEFAVVEASLLNPAPDYKMLRPQWRALANNIALLAIRYYDLATDELHQETIPEESPLNGPMTE
jgi:hypothetical protein